MDALEVVMSEDNKQVRKRKLSEQKRSAIIAGAIQIFTEKGFEASSMDKIAEAAGVSKITVYNHFQSKENLFQEIVADFVRQGSEKKPIAYDSSRSLESQLLDFINAERYWVSEPEQRGLSKLLTSVYLNNMDFVIETMSRRPFHQDFMAWLKAAKADSKLCYDSEKLTAQIFYGMIEGCLTWNALLTGGESLKGTEPLIDEMINTFLIRYRC
jgi:TetR/AcrR family transcriptional regulator of autoinduction and epiphytic fitness